MSWLALGLILISAVLHAAWNYIAKSAEDSVAFLWGVCAVTPLVSVLVCVGAWLFFDTPLDLSTWQLAILGGFFQGIYVALMGAGYNRGDLSVVYPVARGLAPLIIAVIAWIALNEQPSTVGIIAMFAVLAGAVVLAVDMWREEADAVGAGRSSLIIAIGAAVTIAAYHVIDKAGAQGANVVSYLLLMQIVLIVVLTPFVFQRRGAARVVGAVRNSLGAVAVSAALLYAAYALVVAAMMFEDVAYIAAARNISILFGIILGVRNLDEGQPGVRIVAGLLISGGIITLAAGG